MDNVILITVDSLHPGFIGHIGGKNGNTPRLDSLAGENVLCKRAYANGIPTYFAFRSILGGRREVVDHRPIGIPSGWRSIAEVFSNSGYETAGFSAANPWLTSNFNYDMGFDTFEDFFSSEDNSESRGTLVELMQKFQHRIPDRGPLRDKLGLLARTYCTLTNNYPLESSDTVTKRALEWVRARESEQPFFLWVHYMDPHYPWIPSSIDFSTIEIAKIWHQVSHIYNDSDHTPTQQTLDRVKQLYVNEVANVDDSIGKLVNNIPGDRDTIFCVTADHGTEIGDHGGFSHGPDSLYEEVTRVPLVIAREDLPSETITEPVQHVDIPTTLVDLAIPKKSVTDKGWVGNNLLEDQREFALTQVIYDYNPAVSEKKHSDTLNAVVDWPWKLHWNRHTESVELYHLDDDPTEREDVSGQRENIVTKLQNLILEEKSCLEDEYRTAVEITKIRRRLAQIES